MEASKRTESAVAIIGAGLAGLYAAYRLDQLGQDFVLLEARDRLGGRIFTADHSGAASVDGFDLGPSWYWPHAQPAIGELVRELKLAAFCQNSEGDVVFERMSREAPQRYQGFAQEQQSMRLAGGTGALVQALARGIPQEKIWLNTRVTAMKLLRGGVELTLAHSDSPSQQLTTGQVIAAMPPRLLEALVRFSPALDPVTAQKWRATPTWMAPHAKFFALYDRPFWREAGLSGTAQSMVGPMVEMHDATTASGAAALFGFLGVSAEQRAAVNLDTLKQACIAQFARLFGEKALYPRAMLLKDWTTDEFTATAADRIATGHLAPSEEPWVTGPWEERLTLGGSETSSSEPGYLAGAISAAKHAVEAAIAKSDQGNRGP